MIFYREPALRARLGALVRYPRQQLALQFDHWYYIIDVTVMADVHTLKLASCRNISDVTVQGDKLDAEVLPRHHGREGPG